jgi:restriction endonuclease S subunit
LESFQEFEKSRIPPQPQTAKAFIVSDLKADNPTIRLDAHFFDPRYFATMNTIDDMAATKNWKVERLGDLLRPGKSNLAGGATPRGASYPDEGPKFIRVQNVKPYRLVWDPDADPCIDSKTHTKDLKRSRLKKGDVVLTVTGTYGVAAVVPPDFGDANINQHSVKMETGPKIDPEYLSVFLNSTLCRPQFDRAVTGSSRLALDYTSIRNLRIAYPESINEQQIVAQSVIDKLSQAAVLQKDADEITEIVPGLLG